MRCAKALAYGAQGATVEDETPNRMCPNEATWLIERDGVRARIRCDEHAQEFRALPPEMGVVFTRLVEGSEE